MVSIGDTVLVIDGKRKGLSGILKSIYPAEGHIFVGIKGFDNTYTVYIHIEHVITITEENNPELFI